jgi:hypothetical protein
MIILDDSRAGEFPLPLLRGIEGKDAIKAFVKAEELKGAAKATMLISRCQMDKLSPYHSQKNLKLVCLKQQLKKQD